MNFGNRRGQRGSGEPRLRHAVLCRSVEEDACPVLIDGRFAHLGREIGKLLVQPLLERSVPHRGELGSHDEAGVEFFEQTTFVALADITLLGDLCTILAQLR